MNMNITEEMAWIIMGALAVSENEGYWGVTQDAPEFDFQKTESEIVRELKALYPKVAESYRRNGFDLNSRS